MQMASLAWKMKKITAGQSYTNASDIKSWIDSELPPGTTFATIMIDNIDKSAWANNQMVQVNYLDSSAFNYIRHRNGAYGNGTTFSGSYDLVASIGESYTIFYQ